jgi:hypothetical protein
MKNGYEKSERKKSLSAFKIRSNIISIFKFKRRERDFKMKN